MFPEQILEGLLCNLMAGPSIYFSNGFTLKQPIVDARQCLNVSIAPITAMGCWQCLPLSVVQVEKFGVKALA